MKLFSLPDGAIDRKDRAQWLTCPFDLAFLAGAVVGGPYRIAAALVYVPGVRAASDFAAGAVAADSFVAGAVTAKGGPG